MSVLILTASGFCIGAIVTAKLNQTQVGSVFLTGLKHETLLQHKHIEMNNPKLTINVCEIVNIGQP
jgi:hypothetical protein